MQADEATGRNPSQMPPAASRGSGPSRGGGAGGARLAPPFFASDGTGTAPPAGRPEPTPARSAAPAPAATPASWEGAETPWANPDADAPSGAAGSGGEEAFPWEGEPADGGELLLSETVDAGELLLTDVAAPTPSPVDEDAGVADVEAEGGSFPPEAFYVPADAERAPAGAVPGSAPPMDDAEALAERLEQIARRLRHEGTGHLADRIGSGDRFEAILAAAITGYLAGRRDSRG